MMSGGWLDLLILSYSIVNNVGGGIAGVRLHEISEEAWDASMCVIFQSQSQICVIWTSHILRLHCSVASVCINLRALGKIFTLVLLLKSLLGI